MEKNFEYDREIDSLCIYDNFDSKKIEGCLVLDNLIFDIAEDGEVIGLEVDNASRFLKIKPESLLKIKQAEIRIKGENDSVFLGFMIKVNNEKHNFSYILKRKGRKITTCM